MPKISAMPAPAALTGLELTPLLQGGGNDANVGAPILAYGALPRGAVLKLRTAMTADLSATTDADPGVGKVRWNNASPDAAMELFIGATDGGGGDLLAAIAALGVGGFIYVQANGTSDRRDTWQKWQATSIATSSGYAQVGVTLNASAGAFVDAESIELTIQQPTPSPGVDRNVVTTLTSSAGVVTVDCSLGDYFTLALTEAVTGWTFTNIPAGASLMIRITQAATPVSVAWPASFAWAGGSAGAVSSVASAVDLLAVTSIDAGGTWLATLAKAFA